MAGNTHGESNTANAGASTVTNGKGTGKGKKSTKLKELTGMSYVADILLTLICFILFGALLWLLKKNQELEYLKYFLLAILGTAIVIPMCKFVIFPNIYPFLTNSKKRSKQNCRKYCDQSWQLVVHVVMTCYEIHLIQKGSNWSWWFNTATIWEPNQSTDILDAIRIFYLVQLGIWFGVAFNVVKGSRVLINNNDITKFDNVSFNVYLLELITQ